jgi:tetratricopeptide (TPR) repeat protein
MQDQAAAAPAPDPSATVSDMDDTVDSPEDGLTQAYLLLAQAAEQRNDYPGAESWLRKVDNPQRALEVQTRRASLLAKQGRMAEARELIRKVPERTPEDARAKYLAEAQMLRDNKDWKGANDVLAQANQRFPNDVDMLYEQSMMEEKIGQHDEMERLLRRVIELKPDHHHAYNALGYSLAERNIRLPEARDLIRKALDLQPGEPFITDSLGWVEYRMGDLDNSIVHLRQAYKSRPDTEIAAHLGEVLWAAGQKDEARKVWSEGRDKDSGNDVLKETLARLRVDL